jgi:hypothetical protein
MTDAGGLDRDAAVKSAHERDLLLRQIADALNIPVSTFHRRSSAALGRCGPSAAECAALLAAFSRIEDPCLRMECLALVQRYGDA